VGKSFLCFLRAFVVNQPPGCISSSVPARPIRLPVRESPRRQIVGCVNWQWFDIRLSNQERCASMATGIGPDSPPGAG
jgi:hypothetical protein